MRSEDDDGFGTEEVIQGYASRALNTFEGSRFDVIVSDYEVGSADVHYMEMDFDRESIKAFWFFESKEQEDELVGEVNRFLSEVDHYLEDWVPVHKLEPVGRITSNISERPDVEGDIYVSDDLGGEELDLVSELLGVDVGSGEYDELKFSEE